MMAVLNQSNSEYLKGVDSDKASSEWAWQSHKRGAVEAALRSLGCQGKRLRFAEIGSRDGRATRHFADFLDAAEAHAFEVGAEPLRQAQERGLLTHVWVAGESDPPVPAESLDVVLTMDVIEHIQEPERFVKAIANVLAPGGLLVLTTPNLVWWWSRLQVLFGRQPCGAPGVSPNQSYDARCDPRHIRVGTLTEWCRLLKDCGFEIEETRGYHYPKHLRRWFRPVDALASKVPSFANSFVVSARKPSAS